MYIPDRRDIIWLDFDPQLGREIQKMRPALTISPANYNEKTGLGLFIPITSHVKAYPFEVLIDHDLVSGAMLCDQIKSLDWKARSAQYVVTISQAQMQKVTDKLKVLLF